MVDNLGKYGNQIQINQNFSHYYTLAVWSLEKKYNKQMQAHSDDSADAKGIDRRGKDDKDVKGVRGGSLLPKLSDAGEETRKVIKWLSFAKSNVSFGFQHLGPAYLPLMSEERHGYGLYFDKVSGWNIPQSVIKSFGEGDYEVVAQLSLSFYQISTNTFFGSTWMSPAVSLGNSKRISNNILEFECNDLTYFVTRIIDIACVAVVEIVVSKVDSTKNIILNQFGCGWTMLEIFGKTPLDVADERDNIPLQSCSIFSGSPRDMLMNTDIKSLAKLLKEIPKCSLFYKLYGHRRLLKMSKLIGENEIVGRFDEVAGLVAKEVVLPNSTRPEYVACLADEERIDENSVVHIYPARPRLAMTMVFKIANCQLLIPKRDHLELKMIDAVQKLHPRADKKDINILHRYLKVGLHNGHTVIGGHWLNQVLIEDKDDREILLTKDKVLNLYGYVPDPFMALAFVIEYHVGVTIQEVNHYDSKSIVASVTKKPEVVVSQAILGTAVFIPYDGKQIRLSNRDKEKEGSQEDVDIEVKILKDETCAILSPAPLIQDETTPSTGIAAAPSKAGPSKGDDTKAEERIRNRFSYVRDSKSSLTIPKGSTQPQQQQLQVDEYEDAMLGFDLRIFHPIRGEIKNDENVESLIKIEEKEPSKPLEDGDEKGPLKEDGTEEDERFLKKREEEGLRDSTTRFDRNRKGPRISTTSERRGRYDEDDGSSVVESIVSTGERGKSYLRIDRNYYDGTKARTREGADFRDDATDHSDHSIPLRDRSLGGAEGKSHLYSQALNARLRPSTTEGRGRGELLSSSAHIEDSRVASKTFISLKGNEHYMREMTRGAKSRLNRYGIQDAVVDSAYHAVQTASALGSKIQSPYSMKNRLPFGGISRQPIDLEVEISDELCLHEINIQFAGFRPRSVDISNSSQNPEVTPIIGMHLPRAIYFSFQFYTCAPTRTEALRVVPTNSASELHVLVRDDRDVRDEPPMALRYMIDCSESSPYEVIEFTDYLAHKSLYVDVWDADGLMYIGTFGIPLRILMRQSTPMVKQTIECDVINAEISAASEGGVTLLTITENGPVAGEVVGSVSVVLANYGSEGKGPHRVKKGNRTPSSHARVPIEGLNWRAHGVDERGINQSPVAKQSHRPRNIVRAKPLSDTAPDLSKALTDLRQITRDGPVTRSLAAGRNFKGNSTLNYDEIMIIYRKFEGVSKGSVQYAGSLMVLMDLPSYPVAIKKFIKAFKSYADVTFFKEELLRFANSAEELKVIDTEEMLRIIFEKTGIKSRQEERILLAQRIANEYADSIHTQEGHIKVKQIIDFISEETDRADWLVVSKRLQLCAQKAEMDGNDVEQMLAEYDIAGNHAIPLKLFREFLQKLSSFGKLLPYDIALCCRYFSRLQRRQPRKHVRAEDPPIPNEDISCEEVMATLGRPYIGNLQLRIQRFIKEENIELKYVLRLFNHGIINQDPPETSNKKEINRSADGFYSFDQIESVFRSLQLFSNCITIEQFNIICQKLDKKKQQKLSLTQILQYLGIPFKASDVAISPRAATGNAGQGPETRKKSLNIEIPGELTAEFLLNILLQKVQENGVAVDQAFRHFDTNGDGMLSRKEIEEGLTQLAIFDSIPNWKSQLPSLVKKFDTNGDGSVSLREFFTYLGIKDYTPNIIQRLTKIFIIATENKMSFKDIFVELDEDKNGTLDVGEIYLGLQRLGTFNDVTKEDCEAIVQQFDKNGDHTVSIEEFTEYFHHRVKEGLKIRKQRQAETQRKVLQQRFRDVMIVAQQKGATIKQIFQHLDRDKGGTVSIDELFVQLKALPNFKTVKNEEDIRDLLKAMDVDGSGDISYEEFESFINVGSDNISLSSSLTSPRGLSQSQGGVQRTIYDQIRETFGAAQAKGLSFEQFFSIIDKDRSGELSVSELETILRRIPTFKKITPTEVRTLFDLIDTDHSGLISVDEFKTFVVEGKKDYQEDKRFANNRRSVDDDQPTPYELEQEEEEKRRKRLQDEYSHSSEGIKEKFLRHMRKTAEYNGGIRSIFATLDYDGDGIITYLSLVSFLRREDFYDLLNEEQIDLVLQPFFTNKHRQSLYVVPLIQWLTGEKGEPKRIIIAAEQDEIDAKSLAADALPEYTFSTHPEIKAVEKKLRAFGQLLAKKGVDVEGKFQYYDSHKTGCISRIDFIKVLSDLGIYLLEEGKVLKENQLNTVGSTGAYSEDMIRQLQRRQIHDLKGAEGGSSFVSNAPRLARKMFYSDYPSNLLGNNTSQQNSEFKNHLESLTLIDWYRQGQKQMLLQHVLSHSLAHTMHLYPRFGKSLFFEYPIHNPFHHEERFEIEINDSELRLVTNMDEWQHLRKTVKPCVGELGNDPLEVELFDYDHQTGKISVTLLPNEVLYLPFTFMTLIPYIPMQRRLFQRKSSKLLPNNSRQEEKYPEFKDNEESKLMEDEEGLLEDVQRILDVKIISGSHGHLVAILRAHLHPRPFITHRVLRFHEYENSIAKRKIRLIGIQDEDFSVYFPGKYMTEMKYIHCVENSNRESGSSAVRGEEGNNSRVVIEWGSRLEESSFPVQDDHIHSLDMLIRYRCLDASTSGMFYILVYNDPYQSELHEIWQVIIYSRLRLDIHGMVGTPTAADLVIRGDRFPRRVRAFASALASSQSISFKPDSVFQLVPGAYNRVMATIIPKQLGYRRALINVVDADSKELLSVWLASIHATAPAVMRSYDVEVSIGKPMYKKILFKNLWDSKRKFSLTSSDETLMRPRISAVEIGPQGTEYIRLWFNGWNPQSYDSRGVVKEVYFFLNDAVSGQSEECNLFRVRLAA